MIQRFSWIYAGIWMIFSTKAITLASVKEFVVVIENLLRNPNWHLLNKNIHLFYFFVSSKILVKKWADNLKDHGDRLFLYFLLFTDRQTCLFKLINVRTTNLKFNCCILPLKNLNYICVDPVDPDIPVFPLSLIFEVLQKLENNIDLYVGTYWITFKLPLFNVRMQIG